MQNKTYIKHFDILNHEQYLYMTLTYIFFNISKKYVNGTFP